MMVAENAADSAIRIVETCIFIAFCSWIRAWPGQNDAGSPRDRFNNLDLRSGQDGQDLDRMFSVILSTRLPFVIKAFSLFGQDRQDILKNNM